MKTTLMTRALPLLALALAAAGCPSSDGSCESAAACSDGEICFAGRCVATLPFGSCTPPDAGTIGTPVTLTTAQPGVCSPGLPATWPQPVPPAATGWESSKGVHAVGATVTFDVPAGTSSVTIHQQGVTGAAYFTYSYYGSMYTIPNSVVPTAVKAPNGATVFEDDLVASAPTEPRLETAYVGGYSPWGGSFTVPATSRLLDLALSGGELPAGQWSFQVNDWNAECASIAGCYPSTSGTYDVTVIARPGPFVSTGTLDVGIYLAGGTVDAATASTDPAYLRFVWGISQVLGRAGICLGTVTFFDTPAWAPTTPDINQDAPCSDLSQLFSLASPTVDGVHLFLVDDLCMGTNCSTGIIGIDGSIPGPSGLPGAVASGAAMIMSEIGTGTCLNGSFDINACGSDFAAYVAAHEIGHWLGLYHTTEATGGQFDPLAATPTCSCSDCAASNEKAYCDFYDPSMATVMNPAWCLSQGKTCGGGDNLMFWVVDPAVSVGQLSSEQGLVMRVNPAVK